MIAATVSRPCGVLKSYAAPLINCSSNTVEFDRLARSRVREGQILTRNSESESRGARPGPRLCAIASEVHPRLARLAYVQYYNVLSIRGVFCQ